MVSWILFPFGMKFYQCQKSSLLNKGLFFAIYIMGSELGDKNRINKLLSNFKLIITIQIWNL